MSYIETGSSDTLNIKHIKADPKSLRLLERNARSLTGQAYRRLVDNVRRDGALSSSPLLCREEDGALLVLSGNHRVKASLEVGLPEIDCLLIEDKLTESQKRAIALSHNSIAGQDDRNVLLELLESLTIEDKEYAFLDAAALEKSLDKLALTSIDIDDGFRYIVLAFVGDELEQMQTLIDMLHSLDKEQIELGHLDQYEAVARQIAAIKAEHRIKNASLAFRLLIETSLEARA